jgi:hypothetical protein
MPEPDQSDYLDRLDSLDLSELLALERGNPDDIDLLIRIGRSYFKLRQLDKCGEYYVRALKIDPHDGWSHLYFGNLGYAFGTGAQPVPCHTFDGTPIKPPALRQVGRRTQIVPRSRPRERRVRAVGNTSR